LTYNSISGDASANRRPCSLSGLPALRRFPARDQERRHADTRRPREDVLIHHGQNEIRPAIAPSGFANLSIDLDEHLANVSLEDIGGPAADDLFPFHG
jgi:hypothetical protein